MFGEANLTCDQRHGPERCEHDEIDPFVVMAARRHDLEALAAANRAACDQLLNMARQQGEILTGALQRVCEAARDGNREPAVNLARGIWDRALVEIRAQTEKAFCAQLDAMDYIGRRTTEHAREMQTLLV